ncbi:methionine biosynthesis protein MetW [Candidatus Omnitrophota bacterium]
MHDINGKKADYSLIIDFVEQGSKVLDLGCGDGALLRSLIDQKQVRGRGVDIDEENVIAAINKGVSVFQLNIDEGLADYQDNSFDYVILNQTIQEVAKPDLVVEEMLRVGKKVVVSFPNFGNIKLLLYMLFCGKMPKSKQLPFEWYDTPNIHFLTVNDFRSFCRTQGIQIIKEVYLTGERLQEPRWFNRPFVNWIVDEALFVISKDLS